MLLACSQDDGHAPSHEAPFSDEALYALLLDVCHFTLCRAVMPAAAEQEEERQRQVPAALTALQRLLAPETLSKGLCSVDQCSDVLGWILSFLQEVMCASFYLTFTGGTLHRQTHCIQMMCLRAHNMRSGCR